ncbi:MAG: T9SS type A sorting domain-containing protein [Bacteroidetes bacterium]|nr:T9SS type A sorting domain-containing protein [Bacteroidota bacterium]
MKKMWLTNLILCFSIQVIYSQGFHVKSTSIADKQTGVALVSAYNIRFSEPIDILKIADWNDHSGTSPVPFLNVVLKGKDQSDYPILSYQINDSATVLTLNLQLKAESTYEVRIWGGRSLTLVDLDYFTQSFTTSPTFPTAVISGKITNEFSAENDYLLLIPSEISLFNSELDVLIDAYRMAVISQMGTFSFADIEDGSYQIVLIGNRAGDPFFDYTEGDEIGIYDKDKNAIPDPVEITGGLSVSGIELAFFSSDPSPTETNQTLAAQFASTWTDDSKLWMVQSLRPVDSLGVSDSWMYAFFSYSTGKMINLMYSGSTLLLAIEEMMPLTQKREMQGLYPVWKGSSEVAASILEQVKKRPYYYPGFHLEMRMVLGPIFFEFVDFEKGLFERKLNSWSKIKNKPIQLTKPINLREAEYSDLIKPVWYCEVDTLDEKCKCKSILADEYLVSGFTAHILSFELAEAKIAFTELDMDLKWTNSTEEVVSLFSFDLTENGISEWGQVTYDKVSFKFKAYFTFGNVSLPIDMSYPIQIPGHLLKPIKGNWMDSPEAILIADQAFFAEEHYQTGRNLTLMNEVQFFPRDTSLYWYANYYDYFVGKKPDLSVKEKMTEKVKSLFNSDVALNARTGEVRKDSIIYARTRLDDVISEAKKWNQNAELFNVEAVGMVGQKGTTAWVYDFKRPIVNDYLRVFASASDLLTVPVIIPVGIPVENETLTTDFIGDDSVGVIQSIYGEIDSPVSAVALFSYNGQPIWVLKPDFNSEDFVRKSGSPILDEDEFFYYLDGKTGRLIESMDMLFNEKAGMRSAFGSIPALLSGKSLKAIRTENIDSTGKARVWRYIWSLANGGALMTLTHGNMDVPVLDENTEPEMIQYISSIPELVPGWMGSGEVATIVLNWVQAHPIDKNIGRVSATLLTGEFPEFTLPVDHNTQYWFFEFSETDSDWDSVIVVKARTGEIYTSVSQVQGDITAFALDQNYPNPFNPETTIRFSLPEQQQVKLSLYTITGQEIGILLNETRKAGVHQISFKADNLSSGIYLYKIESGSRSITRKMVLIR